ncbi:type II restriction endonuclease [Klebsiella michiganensis]|uniref:type II restriction endonuclease n=1 Tax=Klebsiella michiganensis TaxID=1134687 RepID=UPI003EE08159
MAINSVLLKQSCIKTLSPVEAERNRSNQHEFNGVAHLKHLFGTHRFTRDAQFSILGSSISCTESITWYDARESNPERTEHRLYFRENPVMKQAQTGDNIIVGIDHSDNIHVILIKQSSPDYNGNIPNWK